MQHLEASHGRLHFAGAASFQDEDCLIEARVPPESADDAPRGDAEADPASATAAFMQRFPTWQVQPFSSAAARPNFVFYRAYGNTVGHRGLSACRTAQAGVPA